MPAGWDTTRLVIFLSVPVIALALAVLGWILMRTTLRSRFQMARQLRLDPDIDEWLIVFNWSRKVLYVPTILVSVLAAALVPFFKADSAVHPVIGGVWLAVFFLNFLIDEYEINLKVLSIVLLSAGVLGLWLGALGWLWPFLRAFRHLHVTMSSAAYLVIAGILLLAVFVSWLRGLFYYVTITPNYLNIQSGPTETAEQISREDYNTRVDTGDFLERLLGFGRLAVTFHESRRQALVMLVGNVGKKAARLESIRATIVVDRMQSPKRDSVEP